MSYIQEGSDLIFQGPDENKFDVRKYMLTHTPKDAQTSDDILDIPELLVYQVIKNRKDGEYYPVSKNDATIIICTTNDQVLYPDTNGKPVCPRCGSTVSVIQGYRNRVADDDEYHGKQCCLLILYTVHQCSDCGKNIFPRFKSLAFRGKCTVRHKEAIAEGSVSSAKTFAQVAEENHASPALVRTMFNAKMAPVRGKLFFESGEHLGIDENGVKTSGNDHSRLPYIIITKSVPDESGKVSQYLVAMEKMRRDTESVIGLLEQLSDVSIVKTMTMDMCAAYREAVKTVMPQCRIIVDRFHLVQSLNDKVSKVATAIFEEKKAEYQAIIKAAIPTDDIEKDDLPFEFGSSARDQVFDLIDKAGDSSDECIQAKADYKFLINNYHNRWFTTNPENLKETSKLRFYRLLKKYPEFDCLYKWKEIMRRSFFDADTQEEALQISQQVEAEIPKGKIYAPLHTYFKTLNHSEWTECIYNYFLDPKGMRYSNGGMERFNETIKDINRMGKGVSKDVLIGKLLAKQIYKTTGHKANTKEDVDKQFYKLLAEYGKEGLKKCDENILRGALVCAGVVSQDELDSMPFDRVADLIRFHYYGETPSGSHDVFLDYIYRHHIFGTTNKDESVMFVVQPKEVSQALGVDEQHRQQILNVLKEDSAFLRKEQLWEARHHCTWEYMFEPHNIEHNWFDWVLW